ncbi:DUF2185 domain-containing protein [Cohnella abietis]|uniref:Immunity protein Imm33 domain-containing protein n=1 Tax=Cohnella abietis TaxID=2507935 RepID=A0A3T1DCM1_9BACL|nr:DUF2185 domain-containing protein [Cohnella abietis]BBI35870.1 hypothetical protein KCTCHS21_52690 [Cohnella abietis]
MFGVKNKKKYKIPGGKIRRLIKTEEGCIATDRITVDGSKVGFMYREEPNTNYPDSGWRFMAGDEDDEYMNNPKNHSVYQVNTICNYDLDIIQFLDAPTGTAFIRDKTGKFVLDEGWENPEN